MPLALSVEAEQEDIMLFCRMLIRARQMEHIPFLGASLEILINLHEKIIK